MEKPIREVQISYGRLLTETENIQEIKQESKVRVEMQTVTVGRIQQSVACEEKTTERLD